eukprot:12179443-Karenia_brevis.AAC.1
MCIRDSFGTLVHYLGLGSSQRLISDEKELQTCYVLQRQAAKEQRPDLPHLRCSVFWPGSRASVERKTNRLVASSMPMRIKSAHLWEMRMRDKRRTSTIGEGGLLTGCRMCAANVPG